MRAAELVPLVLAFLAFSKSRGSSSSSSRGPGLPVPGSRGSQVLLQRTGDDDPITWGRRRLALLTAALGALEPPLSGDRADRVARTLLAQWAHETGRGTAEYNYNLGGWTARRGDDFHTATDRLSGATGFRWTAYPDLPSAVEDQLRRLILTYPSAWSLLVAEPESSAWLDQLSRSGYYTAPANDYARAVAAQRAELARLLP